MQGASNKQAKKMAYEKKFKETMAKKKAAKESNS